MYQKTHVVLSKRYRVPECISLEITSIAPILFKGILTGVHRLVALIICCVCLLWNHLGWVSVVRIGLIIGGIFWGIHINIIVGMNFFTLGISRNVGLLVDGLWLLIDWLWLLVVLLTIRSWTTTTEPATSFRTCQTVEATPKDRGQDP